MKTHFEKNRSEMKKCSGACQQSQVVKITNIGDSITIYKYMYNIAHILPIIYCLLIAY